MRQNIEKVGIIGGTGVYDMPIVDAGNQNIVSTEFGKAQIITGKFDRAPGEVLPFVFVTRHGPSHSVPPHQINYRANIKALQHLGVTHVVATTAVGSLHETTPPGQLVLLDQFIDFTRTRNYTFFDGGPEGVQHTDMTYPYDRALREVLLNAADEADIQLQEKGTYVCTEGPRFETAAEVRMFAQLGGDVVGMTNVPEVVLANEIGLKYAAVSLVTNYGAGISPDPLTHEEVTEAMDANRRKISGLLEAFFELSAGDGGGECCG